MKRDKLFQGICLGVTIFSLMGAITFAASSNKDIKAVLNQGIKIKSGGVVQQMKDSNGKELYPISYNGNTYVPVNSICKMLDVPVRWDNSLQTLFVGAEVQQPKSILKFKSKTSDYSSKVTDKGSLTIVGEDGAETKFNDGIYYDVWNSAVSASINSAYQASIGGTYSSLSFEAYATPKKGSEAKGFKLYVYNVDTEEKLCTIQVDAGKIKTVEDIDITGVKTLGFAADSQSYGNSDGDAYFFNPIIK